MILVFIKFFWNLLEVLPGILQKNLAGILPKDPFEFLSAMPFCIYLRRIFGALEEYFGKIHVRFTG